MTTVSIQERQTKYCQAIMETLNVIGHATNNELLRVLRQHYPKLSATTVHRATSRLATRGKIAVAPSDRSGSMRYDANTELHDHFLCQSCGLLRDINVKDKIIPLLEESIVGCSISGRLTISGICKLCNDNNHERGEMI